MYCETTYKKIQDVLLLVDAVIMHVALLWALHSSGYDSRAYLQPFLLRLSANQITTIVKKIPFISEKKSCKYALFMPQVCVVDPTVINID